MAESRKVKSKKPSNRDAHRSMDRIVGLLVNQISSLQFAFEQSHQILTAAATSNAEEFARFLQEHQEGVSKQEKSISIRINIRNLVKLRSLLRSVSVSGSAVPIFSNGQFLVLISQWDMFIGMVLRWLYETKPEIITNSSRTMTLAQLESFRVMELARSHMIGQEVESVIRESHAKQFEYIENKVGITLRKDLNIWSQFVELTQRRHLVAHTGSAISAQYLEICRDAKAQPASSNLGDKVTITKEYLYSSCDCLLEIGLKLSQVLWRKLKPQELDSAESNLIAVTLELIGKGQYKPVISVLEFALRPPFKFTGARGRLVVTINLAQAYKWSGDEERCKALLDTEDWSAASLDFVLAVAVLEERYDDAAKFVKKIGADGAVKKDDYDDWPLFKKFRETNEFIHAYEAVFGTDQEVKEIPRSAVEMPLSVDSASPASESSFDLNPSPSEGLSKRKRNLNVGTPSNSTRPKKNVADNL